MRPSRLADGSGGSGRSTRMEAAFVRVIDASLTLSRRADRLSTALDDATPLGIIRAPLSADDSLVIALKDVASTQTPVTDEPPTRKKPKIGG